MTTTGLFLIERFGYSRSMSTLIMTFGEVTYKKNNYLIVISEFFLLRLEVFSQLYCVEFSLIDTCLVDQV